MNARRASETAVNKRETKRAELIRVGMAIFTQRGFHSIGLDELIRASGIPKGSFYYYFDSKDTYALCVVRAYGDYFANKIAAHLDDQSRSPLTRLRDFCDEAVVGVLRYEFTRGCLIGNIGQEMGTLDEAFRMLTREVLQDWRGRVQACLDEAVRVNEIATNSDTAALAEFFWSAWEGAVMCSKLELSVRPMQTVADTMFGLVLRAPRAPSGQPNRPAAGVTRRAASHERSSRKRP